jgi:hypothetical protein
VLPARVIKALNLAVLAWVLAPNLSCGTSSSQDGGAGDGGTGIGGTSGGGTSGGGTSGGGTSGGGTSGGGTSGGGTSGGGTSGGGTSGGGTSGGGTSGGGTGGASADAAVDHTQDSVAETGGGCLFEVGYSFHDDGGLRAYSDTSVLTPARAHTIKRTAIGTDAPVECTRAVPCSGASVVTVPAIQAAIAHADVQAALAKTGRMLYGSDPRPFDGTVWVFERADGRGFMVGSGTAPAVPAGLAALEALLRKLTEETLAVPECAALKP